MSRPKTGYRTKDGCRVPGVTTIIGRFKDSGALIQWAYKQGREHEDLAHQGKPAPTRLYEVTEKAADIGTAAHEMVELHIAGKDVRQATSLESLDDDQREKAVSAFHSYRSWERQSRIKIVAQEMALVSEKHRFGGTPDGIGKIGGKLVLIDWKTSNSVYQDYLIQLAAYKQLWEENNPDKPITGGFHLCRFAKTHGDFAHHFYPNLDEAWRAFVLMRELYDLDRGLKKRAA